MTETGTQCKLCRRPLRIGAVLGLVGIPVVVQRQVLPFDRAENCGNSAVAVLTRCTMSLLCRSSCRLRCLRFSSSPELGYDGSEGFFRPFWPFFALLRVVPELSASRSWEALDDEEFFVIGSGGGADAGSWTPRCLATSRALISG